MKVSEQNHADSETGGPEVRRLLGCLQSLIAEQSVIEELAACGPRAIPRRRSNDRAAGANATIASKV